MKTLTREAIRRMVDAPGTGAGGGGNIDIQNMLGGYATEAWVSENFLSIGFFSRLFQAHGPGENEGDPDVDVNPNDMESTITDIEAMFGFWTEQYLSALGRGSGGTGGSTALSDLVDVAIASPTNGQALVYNSTTGKWINQTISGGGTDMATVWSNLAANTNEQINASHLTNALSGYATSSDLTGYLPLSAGSSKPLTGSLYFSGNSGINWGTSTGMLACAPSSGWTGISSTQWGVGATSYQGVIRTNNNDILHYKAGTTYKVWDESNLDISGYLPLTAGSANALTGQLYWDRSDTTYCIIAYDPNRETRYVINHVYSVDSTTNIMTADMTLNSYAHIVTTFAPANTVGYQRLTLGSTNKLNAANNMYGIVRLAGQRNPNNASASVYSGNIVPDVLTAERTWTMPDKTGTVALVDDVSGAFTSLTSTNDTNLSVTIGGTTKEITGLYALRFKSANVTTGNYTTVGDLNNHNGTDAIIIQNYTDTTRWVHQPENTYGACVVFRPTSASVIGQLFWGFNHNSQTPTGNLYWRAKNNLGWADDWHKIAFADGNIATATALTTARTLWGQSFDGTANVSGNMTGVGTIDATGNNTITHSGTTASRFIAINGVGQVELMVASTNWGVYSRTNSNWIIGTNGTNTFMSIGNVGIGTTSPSYLLHVSGVAAAQSFRSTVETGTAPLVVASSTLVTNLNADKLDGYHASDFASASDMTTLQGYFDSSGAANKAVQLKTSRTLWGQSFDGTGNVTGAMTSVGSITCTNNSRISNATGSGGSLYIGRSDDAGWVKMSDMCSRQGDTYWKIKSNGDATFGNMLSNGYVTALSDARYKTIVGDVDLSVEQIAAMPAIRYRWNERRDNGLYVGSIAQDWQTILPEVVMTSDDEQRTLSLSYGVAALLASITTARKVVDHERRIAQLEKENMELRNELNRIKAA